MKGYQKFREILNLTFKKFSKTKICGILGAFTKYWYIFETNIFM